MKPNPRLRRDVFSIGNPRSSELGSATNEKTQAVWPGFGFLVAGAGLPRCARRTGGGGFTRQALTLRGLGLVS